MRTPATAHRASSRPMRHRCRRLLPPVVAALVAALLLAGCAGEASPRGLFRYYTRPVLLPPACRPLADVIRLPVEPALVQDVLARDHDGQLRRRAVLQLLSPVAEARRLIVDDLTRAGYSEVRRDGDSSWWQRPTHRRRPARTEDVSVSLLPLPGRSPGDVVTGLLRLDVPARTYHPVVGCPPAAKETGATG